MGIQINPNYNPNSINSGSTGAPIDNPYNLPYDPNGPTPDPSDFQINWNNPDSTALLMQIEQTYEKLVNWLQNNPDSYNGDLMLLQMTLDIGNNMGKLSSVDQATLTQFMSNQMSSSGTNLMALILDAAVEGTAVNNPNVQQGIGAAYNFLDGMQPMLQKLSSLGGVFSSLYTESQNLNNTTLEQFIQKYTAEISTYNSNPVLTWVDGSGSPMNFEDFTANAAFQVGSFLTQNQGGNVNTYIDSMYQSEIEQIEGLTSNPWELLVLLLSLIDQRDQDNGQDINGYGNNLNMLSKGNGYINDMLAMLKNPTTANMQQFYSDLSNLKNIITLNPNFSSLSGEYNNIVGILNGQTTTSTGQSWTVPAGTTIQLPPGVSISVNGGDVITNTNSTPIEMTFTQATTFKIENTTPGSPLTFGQLAAMGDYADISATLTAATGSSTLISNMDNVMTSFQSIFDAPSNGITQEINNKTTQMQTIESFEQSVYQSIVSQENTVTQNIQSAGS